MALEAATLDNGPSKQGSRSRTLSAVPARANRSRPRRTASSGNRSHAAPLRPQPPGLPQSRRSSHVACRRHAAPCGQKAAAERRHPCAPHRQSRPSGTAPGAPDWRDRHVANAVAGRPAGWRRLRSSAEARLPACGGRCGQDRRGCSTPEPAVLASRASRPLVCNVSSGTPAVLRITAAPRHTRYSLMSSSIPAGTAAVEGWRGGLPSSGEDERVRGAADAAFIDGLSTDSAIRWSGHA
jgi:hypothetical protein